MTWKYGARSQNVLNRNTYALIQQHYISIFGGGGGGGGILFFVMKYQILDSTRKAVIDSHRVMT